KYFDRMLRITLTLLNKRREWHLGGSSCDEEEVFETLISKSVEEAEEIASYYDYLEVQPPENYRHLLDREVVQTEAQIIDIINNIVELGKRTDIPVVATGNVHNIDEHE